MQKLTAALRRYLGGVAVRRCKKEGGIKKWYTCFFLQQQWYHHGCGVHPDLVEHKEIAGELTAFLKAYDGLVVQPGSSDVCGAICRDLQRPG